MEPNKQTEIILGWYQQQLANTQLELASKTADLVIAQAQIRELTAKEDPNGSVPGPADQ